MAGKLQSYIDARTNGPDRYQTTYGQTQNDPIPTMVTGPDNLPVQIMQERSEQKYLYDKANRLKQKTLEEGKVFNYTYDGANNLTGVADQDNPDNPTYTWEYDGASRVKNSTDPLGYRLDYKWDENNNLSEEKSTNKGVTAGTVNYRYRSDNKLRSVTLAEGKTFYFNYDETVAYSRSSIRGRMLRKRSFIKGMVGVLRSKIPNFLIRTIITIVIIKTERSRKLPPGRVWMSIRMT